MPNEHWQTETCPKCGEKALNVHYVTRFVGGVGENGLTWEDWDVDVESAKCERCGYGNDGA